MSVLNGVEIISSFLVLFAIIDVTESVLIFQNLESQNRVILELTETSGMPAAFLPSGK